MGTKELPQLQESHSHVAVYRARGNGVQAKQISPSNSQKPSVTSPLHFIGNPGSNFSCPLVSTRAWFQDPLGIPTTSDAQVPSRKWSRSVHTEPAESADAQLQKIAQVLTEKNPRISGPAPSKPVLFTGQCTSRRFKHPRAKMGTGSGLLFVKGGKVQCMAERPHCPGSLGFLYTARSAQGQHRPAGPLAPRVCVGGIGPEAPPGPTPRWPFFWDTLPG